MWRVCRAPAAWGSSRRTHRTTGRRTTRAATREPTAHATRSSARRRRTATAADRSADRTTIAADNVSRTLAPGASLAVSESAPWIRSCTRRTRPSGVALPRLGVRSAHATPPEFSSVTDQYEVPPAAPASPMFVKRAVPAAHAAVNGRVLDDVEVGRRGSIHPRHDVAQHERLRRRRLLTARSQLRRRARTLGSDCDENGVASTTPTAKIAARRNEDRTHLQTPQSSKWFLGGDSMHEHSRPWLPSDFEHPELVDLPTGHHLRPIREAHAADYPRSWVARPPLDDLRRSMGLACADLSYEHDQADLARHERERAHESFNYAVLDAPNPSCSVASTSTRRSVPAPTPTSLVGRRRIGRRPAQGRARRARTEVDSRRMAVRFPPIHRPRHLLVGMAQPARARVGPRLRPDRFGCKRTQRRGYLYAMALRVLVCDAAHTVPQSNDRAATVATTPPLTSNREAGGGREFDAVVVGAGPNGLVAAATLGAAGWRVLVLEAASEPGGGTRSEQLTLPGFVHDVCSAIHPLGAASPAMRALPLAEHGLEWIHPDAPLAHPLDGGRAAVLERGRRRDRGRARPRRRARTGGSFEPFVDAGDALIDALMSPLDIPPRHPLLLARYGAVGIRSATSVAGSLRHRRSRGAVHRPRRPLDPLAAIADHGGIRSVPRCARAPRGLADGEGRIGRDRRGARRDRASRSGGTIECDHRVTSLRELPPARATLLDLTPRQVLALDDGRLPARYRRTLGRFRYGPGVFKVDWALDGPVPWTNPDVRRAATVHVGGTAAEIAAAELEVATGPPPRTTVHAVRAAEPLRPDARAPDGKHTAWAYCHVPEGSTVDMTDAIEAQVERFAPGFRDQILARHTMGPAAMEAHDANYVGGDINGGVSDLRQFFARPAPVAASVGDAGARPLPLLVVDAAGRRRARHVRATRPPGSRCAATAEPPSPTTLRRAAAQRDETIDRRHAGTRVDHRSRTRRRRAARSPAVAARTGTVRRPPPRASPVPDRSPGRGPNRARPVRSRRCPEPWRRGRCRTSARPCARPNPDPRTRQMPRRTRRVGRRRHRPP